MSTRYLVTGHNEVTGLSTTKSAITLAEALDLAEELTKTDVKVTLEQAETICEWVDGHRTV